MSLYFCMLNKFFKILVSKLCTNGAASLYWSHMWSSFCVKYRFRSTGLLDDGFGNVSIDGYAPVPKRPLLPIGSGRGLAGIGMPPRGPPMGPVPLIGYRPVGLSVVRPRAAAIRLPTLYTSFEWRAVCRILNSSSLFDEIADFLVRHGRFHRFPGTFETTAVHNGRTRLFFLFLLTFVCVLQCVYFCVRCWPCSVDVFEALNCPDTFSSLSPFGKAFTNFVARTFRAHRVTHGE